MAPGVAVADGVAEGKAARFSIVCADDYENVHTAPGMDGLVAGVLIGAEGGTIYQRQRSGAASALALNSSIGTLAVRASLRS